MRTSKFFPVFVKGCESAQQSTENSVPVAVAHQTCWNTPAKQIAFSIFHPLTVMPLCYKFGGEPRIK
jgi:hypothetical protein